MSLGKTIIIMIVGKIGIRNNERCCEASFFFMIFLLIMRKTVKFKRNGFVCLVHPNKKPFYGTKPT